MPSLLVVILVVIAAFVSTPRSAIGIPSALPRILLTQLPAGASRELKPAGADLPLGSRIVLFDPSEPRARAPVLTQAFVSAGRPSLSADARRFLFVGRKRAADRLSVWERELESGELRRVAGCEGNCTKAIYASRIYTIDAAEPSPLIVVSAEPAPTRGRHGEVRSALFALWGDGSLTRQITFNPLGASDPLLLSDGRLVYASGIAGEPSASTRLFTIHTDGTEVFPFAAAGDRFWPQRMACESNDGEVVFVESDPRGPLHGGALVAVPRTRSLTERRALSAPSHGSFHSPAPLPDGTILVAFHPEGSGTYGIFRLDPRDPARFEPVFDAPDRHDVDPIAVVPRDLQAGRSSAASETASQGNLYCLDAYRSMVGESRGPGSAAIAFLKVFRAPDEPPLRKRPADSTDQSGVLLGQVPVEPDGSFFLRVPARTALRLETVDAEGNVLRAMRSWIWVMPNESRGCIGCHEDRDLTPPNRMTLALRRAARELAIPAVDPSAAGKLP